MNADDILDQLEELIYQGQVNANQIARLNNVVQKSADEPAVSTQAPSSLRPAAAASPASPDTKIKNPALAAKQSAAVDALRAGITTKTQPAAKPTIPSFSQGNYTAPTMKAPTTNVPKAPTLPSSLTTPKPIPQKFGSRGIPGLGENFYSNFLNKPI